MDGRRAMDALCGNPEASPTRVFGVKDFVAVARVLRDRSHSPPSPDDTQSSRHIVSGSLERLLLAIRSAAGETANRLLAKTYRSDWELDADSLSAAAWGTPYLDRMLVNELTLPVENNASAIRRCIDASQRLRPELSIGHSQAAVLAADLENLRTSLVPAAATELNLKAWSQALARSAPPAHPEIPLVVTGHELELLRSLGDAAFSPVDGKVVDADVNRMTIMPSDGLSASIGAGGVRIEFARECGQQPIRSHVTVGDYVRRGDLLLSGELAYGGALAMGVNLRVGYLSLHGLTSTGAAVVSESAASRLAIRAFSYRWYGAEFGADGPCTDGGRFWEAIADGSQLQSDVADRMRRRSAASPLGGLAHVPDEVRRFVWSVLHGPSASVPEARALIPPMVAELQSRSVPCVADRNAAGEWTAQVAIPSVRPLRVGDYIMSRHGVPMMIGGVLPDSDMPILSDGSPLHAVLPPDRALQEGLEGELYEAWLGSIAELGRRVVAVRGPISFEDLEPLTLLHRCAASTRLAEAYCPSLTERLEQLLVMAAREVRTESETRAGYQEELAQREEELLRAIPTHSEYGFDGATRGCELTWHVILKLTGRAPFGRAYLRDGRSGEALELPVPFGVLHVLPCSSAAPFPRARGIGHADRELDRWEVDPKRGEPQWIDGETLSDLLVHNCGHIAAEFLADKDASDGRRASQVAHQVITHGRMVSFGANRDACDLARFLVACGLEVQVSKDGSHRRLQVPATASSVRARTRKQ
jgi:hypothetical protein